MRWRVAILAALCMSKAAWAADSASLGMMAYSPDNRYFAFEQLGVQDGSGYPYADIFIIDLQKNAWVQGTPIRRLLEDETARPGKVHAAAMDAAQTLISSLDITEPAQYLADLPATEVGLSRTRVAFDRWYNSIGGASAPQKSDTSSRTTLTLTMRDLPTPADCSTYDEPVRGFALAVKRALDSGPEDIIHEDHDVPGSRGCPISYDIAAVVAPAGEPERSTLVAIIAVYTRGFEGYDRRFIAVPVN